MNQFKDPTLLEDGCDAETCTSRVGGDHSEKCDRSITPEEFRAIQRAMFAEAPAEVWCANDDRASVGQVNGQFLCATCFVVAYAEAAR